MFLKHIKARLHFIEKVHILVLKIFRIRHALSNIPKDQILDSLGNFFKKHNFRFSFSKRDAIGLKVVKGNNVSKAKIFLNGFELGPIAFRPVLDFYHCALIHLHS
jgi:hypothetical protein